MDRGESPAYLALTKSARKVLAAIERAVGGTIEVGRVVATPRRPRTLLGG